MNQDLTSDFIEKLSGCTLLACAGLLVAVEQCLQCFVLISHEYRNLHFLPPPQKSILECTKHSITRCVYVPCQATIRIRSIHVRLALGCSRIAAAIYRGTFPCLL